MEWVRIGDVVVNLRNVKNIEVSGKFVVFHFVNDTNPLMVPFRNSEAAATWLDGFFSIAKSTKAQGIDTSSWNLN